MNKTRNNKLTPSAKALRRNMTREERHLWYDFLKTLPVTVHRQKVLGAYIADFYCAAAKTVIEIDGTQHFLPDGQETDKQRDAYFSALGIRVLRYSNRDINTQFERVCADIREQLQTDQSLCRPIKPSP